MNKFTDPAMTPLAKRDLCWAVAVEAGRDGVVHAPAHAGGGHEQRSGRHATFRRSRQDHTAEHDQHDSCGCPSSDVFLKEQPGDHGRGDEFEIEEQ